MKMLTAKRTRQLSLAALCLLGCATGPSSGTAPDDGQEEEYFQGPTGYEDNPVGDDYLKFYKQVAIEQSQLKRMTVQIEDAEGAVIPTHLVNGTITLRDDIDKTFTLSMFLKGEIAGIEPKTDFWVHFSIPYYFEPETNYPWEWVYNYEHLYSEWWNLRRSINETVLTISRDIYDSHGNYVGHEALFPLPVMVDPQTTSLTGHFVLETGTQVSKSELHVEPSADIIMFDNMGTEMRVTLEIVPEERDDK